MAVSTRFGTTLVLAALVGLASSCGAPLQPDALMARAPDGMRVAVATAGARNLRVLHVSGGSIVRLGEVFVPDGEAISAISWSEDGRELIVSTRGPTYAVETRTWRIEPGGAHKRNVAGDAARRS